MSVITSVFRAVGCFLALTAGLLCGCTARVEGGRFQCHPNDPTACPVGWYCLPQGVDHYCFPEVPPDRCGNGEIDPGEQCDGTRIPGDCNAFGFDPGYQLCLVTCRVYCAACGNGRVEMTEAGWGEQCDDGNLRSHDGCSSGCTLEAPQWRPWKHGLGRGRTMPSLVYDTDRERILLFGGVDEYGLQNDTWEYRGTTWQRVRTAHAPPPRSHTDMVYDEARARVVLFGGEDNEGRTLGDTWIFDGSDWQELVSTEHPEARSSHGLAYDAGRDRVVLFGGWSFGYPQMTTWELTGEQWRLVPVTSSPGLRIEHTMAYDPLSRRVILFSGQSENSRGDTWAYDGVTWVELTKPGDPVGRSYGRIAWDGNRGRLVLFGGFEYSGSPLAPDLWEFDGETWAEVHTAHRPPPRFQHGLAFDGSRGRMVLYGGQVGAGAALGDTWELDELDWADVTRPPSPPARAGASLVYAESLQASLLFGGYDDSSGDIIALGDTWLFDGDTWTEATPIAGPPPLFFPAMAYDEALGRVVLFGGLDANRAPSNQTWEFTAAGWTPVEPQEARPSPRYGAAMSYDASRGVLVLFGGAGVQGERNDLWELAGDRWTPIGLDAPPPERWAAAMAYDARRQVMVMAYGARGTGILEDLWEYDGTRWMALSFEERPMGRSSASLVAFEVRGSLMLFGGFASAGPRADTWELLDGTWRQVDIAISPEPRYEVAMAFDARRQTVVAFGGYAPNAETWELRYGSEHPDEVCDNGTDDDGDGLVDCDDPDCNRDARCGPAEECAGAEDLDGDELVGCADPNCGGAACGPNGQKCVATQCTCPHGSEELDCEDGVDNDCNGQTDCEDAACRDDPYCLGGGACSPATPISCGAVVESTTEGGPERHTRYACYGAYTAAGPEAYFLLEPEVRGPVTIEMTSEIDLELFVVGSLPNTTCDVWGPCIAASFNAPPQESVTFDAEAGQRYYVVVDGTPGSAGPFTLGVTCP